MVIPSVIFYFIGGLLIVCGAIRAYVFGWKKRTPELAVVARAEGNLDEPDSETPRRRGRAGPRHLMMGIVWFVMGIVLITSTIAQGRRARTPTDESEGVLIKSSRTYTP